VWARPVRAAAICVSPGQWNGEGELQHNPSVMVVVAVMAPMVVPFVMAAAPVPSVMMAAAPVPAMVTAMAAVSVTMMPATVFDLDYGPVLCGQGRDANSGGSGQGHCQRGNQCRADQNDTSHAGSSGIAG
jgi:hypothetical protein